MIVLIPLLYMFRKKLPGKRPYPKWSAAQYIGFGASIDVSHMAGLVPCRDRKATVDCAGIHEGIGCGNHFNKRRLDAGAVYNPVSGAIRIRDSRVKPIVPE